jgi:DnaA family protein
VSRQLPLALKLRHAPRLEDFVVGHNAAVVDALRRLLEHDGERLVFVAGPSGSGRTHLLSGLCAAGQPRDLRCAYVPLRDHADLSPRMLDGLDDLDLVALDDVDAIAGLDDWERALFNLFNGCVAAGTRMLFSADRGPAALPVTLPDLRTRLAWGLTLALTPLDDAGRLAFLKALAERRALDLDDAVARYLLDRAPRHPRDLAGLIETLDRASLAEQRRLTIPFVRRYLGAAGHVETD